MKTANFEENEIVRADDLQYGFDSQFTNFAKLAKAIICQDKDFIAGGKIVKNAGLTMAIDPVIGISKANNGIFLTNNVSFVAIEAGSSSSRIDTVILKMDLVKDTESQQKRAKISKSEGNTNIVVFDDIYTKKTLQCEIEVIKGEPGSAAAKPKTSGSIKIAEILVPANVSSIASCTIYPVENEFVDGTNDNWTTEKNVTVKVDNLVNNKKVFREEHNQDGSHKNSVIHENNLDTGSGDNQISAKSIPLGEQIGTSFTASDSIFDALKGGSSYTYIVDSDEALLAWANNVAGNDYTSVLIKKGTWNINDKVIDLSATNTKFIIGESGSRININASSGAKTISNALFKGNSSNHNCRFENIYVYVDTQNFYYSVFMDMNNLYNCRVYNRILSENSHSVSGFYDCNNLMNCSGGGVDYAYCVFDECNYLTNCYCDGYSYITSIKNDPPEQIYGCNYLSNCYADVLGHSCNYLVNCNFKGKVSGAGSESNNHWVNVNAPITYPTEK